MKPKPPAGLVVATADQLRQIIREEVRAAFAEASPPDVADVLDTEGVARMLGVNPQTIPRLVKTKGLPSLRRIGTHYRFRRADVLAWMRDSEG